MNFGFEWYLQIQFEANGIDINRMILSSAQSSRVAPTEFQERLYSDLLQFIDVEGQLTDLYGEPDYRFFFSKNRNNKYTRCFDGYRQCSRIAWSVSAYPSMESIFFGPYAFFTGKPPKKSTPLAETATGLQAPGVWLRMKGYLVTTLSAEGHILAAMAHSFQATSWWLYQSQRSIPDLVSPDTF